MSSAAFLDAIVVIDSGLNRLSLKSESVLCYSEWCNDRSPW